MCHFLCLQEAIVLICLSNRFIGQSLSLSLASLFLRSGISALKSHPIAYLNVCCASQGNWLQNMDSWLKIRICAYLNKLARRPKEVNFDSWQTCPTKDLLLSLASWARIKSGHNPRSRHIEIIKRDSVARKLLTFVFLFPVIKHSRNRCLRSQGRSWRFGQNIPSEPKEPF